MLLHIYILLQLIFTITGTERDDVIKEESFMRTPETTKLSKKPFHKNEDVIHITGRVGETATLDCPVTKLGDKIVSWIQKREDRIVLLTYGLQSFNKDMRYKLNLNTYNNWKLEIRDVKLSDQGDYICQVSTHPPIIRKIYLRVSEQFPKITNIHGDEVREIFYRVGSVIDLVCQDVQSSKHQLHWVKDGSHIKSPTILKQKLPSSLQNSAKSSFDGSWLHIDSADSNHSGDYSCASGVRVSNYVRIHVIKEEASATIQHNSSASVYHLRLLYYVIILVTCLFMYCDNFIHS